MLLGDEVTPDLTEPIPELSEFRRQGIDLYIPAGETGYWLGALRDSGEPGYDEVRQSVEEGRGLWIDLLYGDYDGGQRAIVRLVVIPWKGVEGRRASVLRYWNIDRRDPR